MTRSYSPALVALSILIAILASYTALDLAGRVAAARHRVWRAWLAAGSMAMGIGIWSMHFIGMLALELGVPMMYDAPLLALSAAVAVLASGLGLGVAGRLEPKPEWLFAASLCMGVAIAGMHYMGMAALIAPSANRISYDQWLASLSVAIAVAASFAALWLVHRFRGRPTWRTPWHKGAGAVAMGLAVAGMHYTGMAAASFGAPIGPIPDFSGAVLATPGLLSVIVLATTAILSMGLVGAKFDRRMGAQIAETEARKRNEERLEVAERAAQSTAERMRDVAEAQRFLAEAGSVLASSLDYGTTLQSVARLAVPRLADWCLVDIVEPERTIRRVAVAAADPRKAELLEELQRRFPPRWSSAEPPINVLATGQPQLIVEFDRAMLPAIASEASHLTLLETLDPRSLISVPLIAGGRTIGAITCVSSETGRRYSAADLELVLELARRAALAVDHARLYREAQAEIAERVRVEESLLRHGRQLALSAEVGLAAAEGGALRAVLQRCAHALIRHLGVGAVRIWTFDEREQVLVLQAGAGRRGGEQYHRPVPVGSGAVGRIAQSRQPLLLNDVAGAFEGEEQAWAAGEGLIALAGYPLVAKGRLLGVVAVLSATPMSGDTITALQSVADRVVLAVERDRVEETLRSSEEQLRQAQKMEAVGQLAGGVAHDFNNMLTAIKSYSELLLESLPPEDELRSDVDEIRKAADRAATLTRQLLAFSRKQMLQPRVINLNVIIPGMEQMLRRLLVADVELTTSLDPALAPVTADPGQVEQILMNLVVNARDAMPDGGRVLIQTANAELDDTLVDQQDQAQPGRYVMLSVSDTGCGMDRDTQSRIFEPFFTTKGGTTGTGLGLSTVYGIVKQSGGHIWVYSEVGQGTTFKIYLPRVEAEEHAPPEGAAAVLASRGTETILLVDDEEAVRRPVRKILERTGYTVLEASNGAEAILLCEQHGPSIDLVITDVMMPGMTGGELVQHLHRVLPGARVLFTSGYTDDEIVRRGLLDAQRAFIQKPFTLRALVAKVREVLSPPAGARPR